MESALILILVGSCSGTVNGMPFSSVGTAGSASAPLAVSTTYLATDAAPFATCSACRVRISEERVAMSLSPPRAGIDSTAVSVALANDVALSAASSASEEKSTVER